MPAIPNGAKNRWLARLFAPFGKVLSITHIGATSRQKERKIMKTSAIIIPLTICLMLFAGVCLADNYQHQERYHENSATFEGRRQPMNPFRAIGEIAGTVVRAPIEICRGMADAASGRKALGESSYQIQEGPNGINASYRNYPYDPQGRLPTPRYYNRYGNYYGQGGIRAQVGSRGWRIQVGN